MSRTASLLSKNLAGIWRHTTDIFSWPNIEMRTKDCQTITFLLLKSSGLVLLDAIF